MCFSTPNIPKQAPAPPPPTAQDPAILGARALSRKRQQLAAGRASTISTGPLGPATSAPAYTKTLLGA